MSNGNEEDYDWKQLNMLPGLDTRKIISKITDKANWRRKDALDDEIWSTDIRDKI